MSSQETLADVGLRYIQAIGEASTALYTMGLKPRRVLMKHHVWNCIVAYHNESPISLSTGPKRHLRGAFVYIVSDIELFDFLVLDGAISI